MSATGRGGRRMEDDFYETPRACTLAALTVYEENLTGAFDLDPEFYPQTIVDPGCGSGAIARVLRERYPKSRLTGVELDADRADQARAYCSSVHTGDLLTWEPPPPEIPSVFPEYAKTSFVLALGNPPYEFAREFANWCFSHAVYTGLLLRLNFLASRGRRQWFKEHPCNVYVLPDRPSFAQSISCSKKRDRVTPCNFHITLALTSEPPRICPMCGARTKITKSDATEYGWFFWGPGLGGLWGYADPPDEVSTAPEAPKAKRGKRKPAAPAVVP